MNNNIVAIGDLHGHYNELQELYGKVLDDGIDPSSTTFVFLGDYVDGGPDTNKVVQWLIDKEKEFPHWVFLYGNHEDLMLDALKYNGRKYKSYDLWYTQGGKQTAWSYYPTELSRYEKSISQPSDHILQDHIDWLDKLPLCFVSDDYFLVHAGLTPGFSVQDHIRIAKEGPATVEEGYVLQNMIWIREGFIDNEEDFGRKVIFGHTVFPHYQVGKKYGLWCKPLVMKNKIGIDCMAHNRGRLVAIKLPEEKFYETEYRD